MPTAAVIATNPFALMVQPDAVLQAMEKSSALRSLRQRQVRPLDREEDLAADAAPAKQPLQPLPLASADPAPWLRGIARGDVSIYSSLLN